MSKRANANNEIFQGIMTVKSFNTEKKEIDRYQTHLDELNVYESRK